MSPKAARPSNGTPPVLGRGLSDTVLSMTSSSGDRHRSCTGLQGWGPSGRVARRLPRTTRRRVWRSWIVSARAVFGGEVVLQVFRPRLDGKFAGHRPHDLHLGALFEDDPPRPRCPLR